MRTVVVGAGFAGLAAADALRGRGADVVVVEARQRVGGRVWSPRLANGAVIERGAEFIVPGSTTLLALAAELGLPLRDKATLYARRAPHGLPVPVAPAEVDQAWALAAAAAGAQPPPPTAAALLAQLPVTAQVREALTARLEISSAAPADALDPSVGALGAHGDVGAPSIEGGNQRLAEALADRIGRHRLRLATPVVRLAWGGGGGVTVTTARGEQLRAERAVLAVPATVLGRIELDPPLPGPVRDCLAALRYGQAAKLFVPLARPAAPAAVMSVPGRWWSWTAPDDGSPPLVSAFAGGARALEALGVAHGPDRWLAALRALRPELDLEPEGAVLSTWHDDPWVAGAYSTKAPGRDDGPLTAPIGPVVLCGEHTAGSWSSLMEGALRSGLRAAEQVS